MINIEHQLVKSLRCPRYDAMNGSAKCRKMGWFAMVRGHSKSRAVSLSSIERIRLLIRL